MEDNRYKELEYKYARLLDEKDAEIANVRVELTNSEKAYNLTLDMLMKSRNECESCEKALGERDEAAQRMAARMQEIAREVISLESEIKRLQKEKEESQKFQKESRIKRKAEMRALESEKKALVEALSVMPSSKLRMFVSWLNAKYGGVTK